MSAVPSVIGREVPLPAALVEPKPSAPRDKLLIIHHAAASRGVLAGALQAQFEIRHAWDAEEAWHTLLTDRSIRAVVASVPVLAIDGYGLLQRMRRSQVPRITHGPVIVVTDRDDDAIGALVMSFGASACSSLDRLDGLTEQLHALIDPPTRAPSHKPAAVITLLGDRIPATGSIAPDARTAPSIPNTETEHCMSRVEDLNKVLKTLQNSSPGVEASALISSDGLMIASALAKEMDETRVAAMTATLLSLGTRAANELRRGEISEVIVRGDQGYAVMLSAGRGALLLVLATEATPLGLIFFDMREAVKGIKSIL